MDMIKRPRRLRGGETIRKMIRETRMDKSSLIYPMFVQEGTGREDEIPSMPGQFRYTLDRLPYELERLAKAGVGSVMLLGGKRKIPGTVLYYRCVPVRVHQSWSLRHALRS